MSLMIKKQILSIINTLESTTQMFPSLLIHESQDTIIELLTECQNCAIEIGNKIEQIYPENSQVISALEDYCEAIYQFAQSMNTPETTEQKLHQLCEHLFIVKEEISNHLSDKKEVVFFPYKASMWDSLESIYLNLKKDPCCDVFCVPIPYYDKNSDGSFGEMHYEIEEYPKNIEVTDYREYDFKLRMPDVIYIHNPYDNGNHVTSVHPDYYAKNLYRFTEDLIYVPYFVLAEIDPHDQGAIDGIKHFCFLPGTIYAHHVILQSENMKQIYVNEFIKQAKAMGLSGNFTDRKIQEARFIGCGSPKLEKAAKVKKEDLQIPTSWLNILKTPKGYDKKLVFYNTSITTFLASPAEMLLKIKDTLDFFYSQKEEVALLWRPHPLMESTISSLHPELLTEYQNIVTQYKEGGWGIYDDSSDLNRAIALSDCYYGDQSSVVQLFQQTQKPIMIQNVHILYQDKSELRTLPRSSF